MGLDTTHDCWHGSYSSFGIWRQKIALAAGIPLDLMEGHFESPSTGLIHPMTQEYLATRVWRWLPISWEVLRPDVLYVLLHHSDCDGDIPTEQCGPLADRLAEVLPDVGDGEGGWQPSIWRERTQTFIDGLRLAASLGEAVEFH